MNEAQNKEAKKRFKSGIEFEKQLLSTTRAIQDRLLSNLSSNYSKDRNTNLAEFFRAVAKEFARLQTSASDINEDKYHESTRTDYLFQILGDTLFLGNKAINESIDDVTYRRFLIRVRDAYFGGSRKDNIESAVSDLLDLPVSLKEVYIRLREDNSFYTIKDTHMMFFDILMDGVDPSSDIGLILEDMKFFIDIIKPAHVLYDTRLIWTEQFTSIEGKCKPVYVMDEMEDTVYGTSLIHMVTYTISDVYKFTTEEPVGDYESGVVASINVDDKILKTVDKRILVYSDTTNFYSWDGSEWVSITITSLSVGDTIRYEGVKDAADSSSVIDDTWLYSGVINDIFLNDETIVLEDGSLITYSDLTYSYTRDEAGEYRINIDDLIIGYEIAFKATKYTEKFQFYITPQGVVDNEIKQFDDSVIEKPTFQEYVVKELDLAEGLVPGPSTIVEDGVIKILNLRPRFYKRDDTVNYKEEKVHRYTLYIDEVYKQQFSQYGEARLTKEQAKAIFVEIYGHTEILDPNTDYNIDVAETGRLIPVSA
ncbi:MAG: hypothetical protein D4S01_08730 [Dehalococcoidia bacterium]|nr:MAG: hypothetical protein D4S01_08730 [Dehalococcoidia bacterium]